ncbi:ATP synthase F0 subunit C [Phascolarctobacterium sp.]|uniref:ATP synthase F0 subunit C n=1 Tax=Phascolarctobacterium sp. TaxID=2049039 RepID=UPI002A813DD6|nr:ATP synthase F0 subunit C [Phascolarctobacterium sp.]MDY5044873.1 ATP synthase F0 subunit C [Phascolarctobacterium sp.]MEE1194098.1 ATP synthase F0 subunit C [Phascolarctobacterium sp.]
MTENAIIIAASLFAVAFTCLGAALGAALGNGNLTGKAIESMARQPEEAGKLFTNMLVSVGLVESMPILCYVIAVVLVFANPFVK